MLLFVYFQFFPTHSESEDVSDEWLDNQAKALISNYL